MQRKDGTVAINLDESVENTNNNGENGTLPKSQPQKSRFKILMYGVIFMVHTAIVCFYGVSVWLDWTYYTPVLHDFELIDEDVLVFFQGYWFKLAYLENMYHVSILGIFYSICMCFIIFDKILSWHTHTFNVI